MYHIPLSVPIQLDRNYNFEESSYGGKVVREITAIIRKQSVLDEVARLQKRAEGLQDELDEFNASVKVEIELDE